MGVWHSLFSFRDFLGLSVALAWNTGHNPPPFMKGPFSFLCLPEGLQVFDLRVKQVVFFFFPGCLVPKISCLEVQRFFQANYLYAPFSGWCPKAVLNYFIFTHTSSGFLCLDQRPHVYIPSISFSVIGVINTQFNVISDSMKWNVALFVTL